MPRLNVEAENSSASVQARLISTAGPGWRKRLCCTNDHHRHISWGSAECRAVSFFSGVCSLVAPLAMHLHLAHLSLYCRLYVTDSPNVLYLTGQKNRLDFFILIGNWLLGLLSNILIKDAFSFLNKGWEVQCMLILTYFDISRMSRLLCREVYHPQEHKTSPVAFDLCTKDYLDLDD